MKKKLLEGEEMYNLAEELFPLCRSITGIGTENTLLRLKQDIPQMKLIRVKSGTKVFDWTVPNEWNIKDAYIDDEFGNRIIDFNDTNLHVVGYSTAVDKIVDLDELQLHLYSLPDQPDWIPYVTSYYSERWGFCMTQKQRDSLQNCKYHVKIDSTLEPGNLMLGEVYIPGKSEKEIFFSTYVCHPSMANNELSGPVVLSKLIQYIQSQKNRDYSYRFVFVPETIGAITYLSNNYITMKKNMIAGYNITCVGDNRTYSYVSTRKGNTLSDKTALYVLNHTVENYKKYSFLERGSDERQYNSPGIDLPVCCLCRSKYHEYPEYHTSADDMSLISPEGLQGTYDLLINIVRILENNKIYKSKCLCEPQLGKRGLYPTESFKGSATYVKSMMDFLAYIDGETDLIDISEQINVEFNELALISEKLLEANLIEVV